MPFDYDPASKDRLKGSEIGSLLFGHTIIYKNRDAVSAASIAFTKEGTPTRTSVGSSEAGILIEDYAAVLEDRGLCFWWRRGGPGMRRCLPQPQREAASRRMSSFGSRQAVSGNFRL